MTLISSSTRVIAPLLILLSLVILYRGHNLPGGGFIGGLTAAAAMMLITLNGVPSKFEKHWNNLSLVLIGSGLVTLFCSFLPSLMTGAAFMEAMWLPTVYLPILGKVKLGTPLIFDIGIYLAVIGFSIKCANVFHANSSSETDH